MKNPSRIDRLVKTFQVNNQQLAFGSYAAELSFYIILAIIPLMLALANVIAVLPFSEAEIVHAIKMALPQQVEDVIVPLLESYLLGTSTSVFSISLIVSLWPASKVLNTLQRLLNTIYKTKARENFFISRLFAYAFTLFTVLIIIVFTFVLVFGNLILDLLYDYFNIDLLFWNQFIPGVWLIGFVGAFVLMVIIYHFMPNVRWSIKYALPGTFFALIGFFAVSQLFTLYLALATNDIGSGTIGVFIVLVIWLYLNAMIIAIGAYLNVFYHDYKEKSYWSLVEETKTYQSFRSYSPHYVKQSKPPRLKNVIYKGNRRNKEVKGENQ